jgi:hypothetical protein
MLSTATTIISSINVKPCCARTFALTCGPQNSCTNGCPFKQKPCQEASFAKPTVNSQKEKVFLKSHTQKVHRSHGSMACFARGMAKKRQEEPDRML